MKDIRDNHRKAIQPYNPLSSSEPPLDETVIEMFEQQQHSNISSPDDESVVPDSGVSRIFGPVGKLCLSQKKTMGKMGKIFIDGPN